VSVLDALARVAADGGSSRVATWVDAWRGEVYAALYEHGAVVEPPSVEPPSGVLARLPRTPTLFIGDGVASHREAILTAMAGTAAMPAALEPPLAATIGIMALACVRAGHRPGAADIQPLYVRRPDAELARDAHGRA
jgi:tRNA A37 threonylcarbamoyladenosine modification protein TsaB